MSSRGVSATTSARPMMAPAERVVAEDGLAQDVEDLVLGIVLVHGDLLEDDLPLGVEVAQRRAPDHVAHDVDGRSTFSSMTREYTDVDSLPVPALISAPMASKSWSISSEL